jgi:D-aspartate ligase
MMTSKTHEKSPEVVLLGGGPISLQVARSLSPHGIKPVVITAKSIEICRFSNCVKRTIRSSFENKCLLDTLRALKSEIEKPILIIPASDSSLEFILQNFKELSNEFIIPYSKKSTIENSLNKRRTYKIAKKAGISIPKTIFPKDIGEAENIAKNLEYPAIVKPVYSHLFNNEFNAKGKIVNNSNELVKFLKLTKDRFDIDNIMIQEFIPGPISNIYSFNSFFKDKKCITYWCGQHKIRQTPAQLGSGSFGKTIYFEELKDTAKRFLAKMDYYGQSEIDFKLDPRDKKLKLMEINARPSLQYYLGPFSGCNPVYWIYLDKSYPRRFQKEQPLKYKKNVYWMMLTTDVKAVIQQILAGELSIKEYVSIFSKKKCFAVWSLKDPAPFLIELLRKLINKIKGVYKVRLPE